jgi:hypothetical protein
MLEFWNATHRWVLIDFRINVTSRARILILWFNSHLLINNSCFLSQCIFRKSRFARGLLIIVMAGRRDRERFFRYIIVEWYFLNDSWSTSLLNANFAPFFLLIPSSQKVRKLYLLEDGETVKHFVKSERDPYPIPAAGFFAWKSLP